MPGRPVSLGLAIARGLVRVACLPWRALRFAWWAFWWFPNDCTRNGRTLDGHRVAPRADAPRPDAVR